MLNILVDTCVWLDIAKDPEQRPLLGVLEELIRLGEIRLIVPQIVPVEFARNKPRIIEDSGRSMGSVFKRVKEAVEKFGDPEKAREVLDQLNDVDHRIPMLGESVNTSIGQIERLLNSARPIRITESVKARAAQRGIDKVAPFHRQRNGIDDSILMEVYSDQSTDPALKEQRFAFVTHNTKDFSDPTGDNRTPHPDLAQMFSKVKSRYFIRLSEAIQSVRKDLVSELMVHHEEWIEEPRKLSEILAALNEMVDKLWYDRHSLRAQQVAEGKIRIVPRKEWEEKQDLAGTIVEDIWAGALRSAKAVERKYGKDNLGPWTEFEWGMLNGKISALRWVLGEDWDELYT